MYLVSGATGNVGYEVAAALLAAGEPVRGLTRNPAAARLPAGAEAVATADAAGDAALTGVTGLFLHAVGAGRDIPKLLAAARAHGVRRVVTLSSQASKWPGNPIGDHHLELERVVEETGLEWVHLRPGVFAANTLAWAGQIRATGAVRLPYPGSHVGPIHERDIADVAVRAFLSDGLVGTRPELTGPESLTMADQVRHIGEAIGRPVACETVDPETARAAMTDGFVTDEMAGWMLRAQESAVHRPAELTPEVERILGRPGRTYARWAADHAADFS
ncbi:SDR family oxidoreductase [Actinomadura atramentaria]|uniref:SDR family oxidoreductase n=1 Tax=Actinomadura atramentaria TaxID=1990 RepID=UPI0003635B09|nr:NAD(P)H-binding protein [Actinomadura atramentaria]